MKIAIRILKVLILIMTSVCGIIFGIFAPLSIMFNDIVDAAISEHYIIKVWLINLAIQLLQQRIIAMTEPRQF